MIAIPATACQFEKQDDGSWRCPACATVYRGRKIPYRDPCPGEPLRPHRDALAALRRCRTCVRWDAEEEGCQQFQGCCRRAKTIKLLRRKECDQYEAAHGDQPRWQTWREQDGRWVGGYVEPGYYSDPPAFEPHPGESLKCPAFPRKRFALAADLSLIHI